MNGLPTATAFLKANEILIAGVGLGTHFSLKNTESDLESTPATGNHRLFWDFAYPTSKLAASLATAKEDPKTSRDTLIDNFLLQKKQFKVEISPALATDTSATGTPQGYYFSAHTGSEELLIEVQHGWSADRPYMVRSMSKAFASSVILAMQDQGILSLEEPVAKYLEEYNTCDYKRITIRMLLSHTAGFPCFMAQVGDESPPALTDHLITLRESAAQIAQIPLVSTPGAEFHYTELGFQVAGALAEVAAGKSWYQLFDEYLAVPLELQNTDWYNTYHAEPRPSNPLIAIGSVTTASDLRILTSMFLNGGLHVQKSTGKSVRVLSQAAINDLTSYQELGDTSKDAIFQQNATLDVLAQPLCAAGLLSQEELDGIGASWSNIGYGLGAWIGKDPSTGSKHVFFLGAYNGCVSLLGWGGEKPLATTLMTLAKSNPTHAVLAGLSWKDYYLIQQGPTAGC